jgi:membrane protease YdiL (CAAX protease family)
MTGLFKTPDGKDLRWGWKAIILIAGTILCGIIMNTVLITVLTITYSSQALTQEQAMEQATIASSEFLPQVILTVLQLGFILLLVRWLVVKVEKRPFTQSQLGLIPAQRSRYILLGIVLAIVLSLLPIGFGVAAGTLKYRGNGFEMFTGAQVLLTILLAIVLAIASGFGEEIAFRGYLQTRIAQHINPWVAVVIVALLFAFSHPPASENQLLYLTSATTVGILFGVILLRTGSLWMGIMLHVVWNYLQIAVLAVRNFADERFVGSPIFMFDNYSSVSQMFVDLGVIVLGLLFVFWVTKPSRVIGGR